MAAVAMNTEGESKRQGKSTQTEYPEQKDEETNGKKAKADMEERGNQLQTRNKMKKVFVTPTSLQPFVIVGS